MRDRLADPAGAQQAGLSTGDFAALIERALFLDRDDPVAAWGELHDTQARLIERLSSARELRIEAEGTDLTLSVEGRTWVNSDGKRNMPSGEVFTGPHEDSAEGRIRYTIPSSPRGVAVEGIELRFEAGRVVEARADRGEDYLRETLATDDGASLLGEIGIGTNFGIDQPVGMILLDEKIGGTVHLAVGRSYPETGGVNESAVHWDMICDLRQGGRLSADGEPILEDGQLRLGRARSSRAPPARRRRGGSARIAAAILCAPARGPGSAEHVLDRRAAARRASPSTAGRSRGACGAPRRARRRRPRGRPRRR